MFLKIYIKEVFTIKDLFLGTLLCATYQVQFSIELNNKFCERFVCVQVCRKSDFCKKKKNYANLKLFWAKL